MIHVTLPDEAERLLPFYLSMEEYVARKMKPGDYFFMWQVEPTVIFGRNQLIESEVNIEYCRRHGIRMFRRKSGGGCVYSDKGNIMFSYITPSEDVTTTFKKYLDAVVRMLRKLGLDASATGRNDIMIGDRKVSGNAFYHVPGRSIVHGTMLYDTDIANMVGGITPDDAKLVSKGVKSVRQHITLLKDHIGMSIDQFKAFALAELCDDEVRLDAAAVAAIGEMERQYLTDEFIYGRNPRYAVVRRRRIDGVGDIEVRMEMRGDMIKSADILGDFFLVGDLDEMTNRLVGRRLCARELADSLPDTRRIIMNLDRDEFVKMLVKQP